MAEKNWTIPEMRTALALLRSLLPEHEIERIIDEVRCEGWSVLGTPTGDVSFKRDDLSLLDKILRD